MILREERIGGQRLLLGDSAAIMPGLGRFDAVVTDPPYGIGFAHGGNDRSGIAAGAYATKFAKVAMAGDYQHFDPSPFLAVSDAVIMWGGNHFADRLPPSPSWLIWDKRAASGHTNDFADCEIAWTNCGGVARVFRHHWDGMMRASEKGIPRVHQTQKPIALMEWCLTLLPKAHTILDPFAGSFMTLVACQKTGKCGTGIEIDPGYFEAGCRRVEAAWRQPDIFIEAQQAQPVQESLI